MKRLHAARVSIGVGLAVLLAGCSSTDVELLSLTEEEYRSEQVNEFIDTPIRSALGLTPADSGDFALETMTRLEVGIERCMQDQGLPYIPHLIRDDVGVTWLPALSRADFASEYGFGASLPDDFNSVAGLVIDDPNDEYLDSLGEDDLMNWEDALLSEDGCRAESGDLVWGPLTPELSRFQEQTSRQVTSHAKATDAVDENLECTADAGYPWLNNPWGAAEIGLETARAEGLSLEAESAAALAELDCRYNLELIARSVQFDIEDGIVSEDAEVFSSLSDEMTGSST